MLWLLVIILIGGLSFVIFHKPHVNSMGAGWSPPSQRNQLALPPGKPVATSRASDNASDLMTSTEDAVTAPVVKQAPQMPDTFNFNDLFGGSKSGPTDRPSA